MRFLLLWYFLEMELRKLGLKITTKSAVCTLLFTAAGSAKVEVNDQQIQTEITETENKSVQTGSTTKQQCVYAIVR